MHTCRWAPRGVKTAIMSRGPDRSPRKPRGVRVANRLTSPATRLTHTHHVHVRGAVCCLLSRHQTITANACLMGFQRFEACARLGALYSGGLSAAPRFF